MMCKSKIIKCLMTLSIAANTIGCSCFVPWCQDFVVAGNPKDAEIVIRGEGSKLSGEAFTLRRNRRYTGEIRREGYEDEQFFIEPELSVWGGLDVFAGSIIILPLIGLCFPGSHTLNKEYYSYSLKPIRNQ